MVLLREFDRVCRELEIPYILFAGSLLGAVRHQGFIPWDDDIDVMMLRKDYDRFMEKANQVLDQEKFFLQREFSEHWPMFFSKLRLNGTTCLEKFHPRDPEIHQGVYMDIFPCDNAADSEFVRKLQYLASKVVIAKAVDKRGYDTDSALKKLVMAVGRCLPLKPFVKLAQKGSREGQYVHTFLGGGREYRKNVFPGAWFRETVEMPFGDGHYPVT
jgi:phosphorylcholine metabolism protein LicD